MNTNRNTGTLHFKAILSYLRCSVPHCVMLRSDYLIQGNVYWLLNFLWRILEFCSDFHDLEHSLAVSSSLSNPTHILICFPQSPDLDVSYKWNDPHLGLMVGSSHYSPTVHWCDRVHQTSLLSDKNITLKIRERASQSSCKMELKCEFILMQNR